jgi:hypothetical protein
MHGWRHPELQVAFCFGQLTKLAESGVAASLPRSSGAWLKRKQRSVRFQVWRPMTSAGPVPVSVIKQEVNWSKSSSYWDTSLCRRPSDTSDANSASTTRSMIGSGSSRIRQDSRGIRLTCRHFVPNPAAQIFSTARTVHTYGRSPSLGQDVTSQIPASLVQSRSPSLLRRDHEIGDGSPTVRIVRHLEVEAESLAVAHQVSERSQNRGDSS